MHMVIQPGSQVIMLVCAGTERRPVVEFAIENAQALKKRALRQTKVQEQTAGRRAPREASAAQEAGSSPAQQQRKRKREDSEVRLSRYTSHAKRHTLHCATVLPSVLALTCCRVTGAPMGGHKRASSITGSVTCMQAPHKAAKVASEGQAPKEGRGQRQRRKKREGAGEGGQAHQAAGQLAGQPEQAGIIKSKRADRPRAAGTSGDRGQESAGQQPAAKKLQATSPDTGDSHTLSSTFVEGRSLKASAVKKLAHSTAYLCLATSGYDVVDACGCRG